MGISSENISNVDTPGYRRKLLMVAAQQTSGDQFMETRVRLDQSEGVRSFDPEHPMADADGYVTMSNVSLVTELADMRDPAGTVPVECAFCSKVLDIAV